MRNSRRWRNIGLAFFASGLVATPVPFIIADSWLGETALGLLFTYGLMALVFGGMAAVIRHSEVRAWDSLRRGEDIIARWHVDGATWRAFLELNRRINQTHPLANELTLYLRKMPPKNGVDIVVSRTGTEIDGDFYHLPPHGVPHVERAALVRGNPSYIDLSLYYPGGGQGASGVPRPPVRTALRFPFGPGAEREGERAFAHYNRDLPGKPDFFHGRGDGTDTEDLSRCYACGYETHKFIRTCPQCGTGLQSRRWSRRFGAALTVCGLILTGLMGTVLYYVLPAMLRPGVDAGGMRFSGTATQALLVLAIMGAVFVFGATALVYGIWQMRTGRRNRKVVYFVVGLASVLFVIAGVIHNI